MRLLGPGDEALLDAFYQDVYLPAFAHQREPVEAWHARLGAHDGAYQHAIVLEGASLDDPEHRCIDGGIVFERYPDSGCGLITYLVVAPHARRAGLGARLLARARDQLRAAGAPLIVAEVHDPAHAPDAAAARRRLAFFERRGARGLDLRYIQPDLGAGLGRDRELRLIAFFDGPPPPSVDGARVRAFLREFYDVVEGRARSSDPEVTAMLAAVPDRIGYFLTVVA